MRRLGGGLDGAGGYEERRSSPRLRVVRERERDLMKSMAMEVSLSLKI